MTHAAQPRGLDPALLGLVVTRGLPFLMEVTPRTEADKKGGHLARARDGRLVLREAAQCHPDDAPAFQDWRRHRFFNTNNLWVDLAAVAALLDARDDHLGLPLIRNKKPLDPTDPASPPVYQLETAMGAALEVFPGADAVRVGRDRFAPVKTTSDLLALASDAFALTADGHLALAPGAAAPPLVHLDPAHYGHIGDLQARIPHGAPSLRACRRLVVRGDVRFGAGVRVVGDVVLDAGGATPLHIPDGAVLEG